MFHIRCKRAFALNLLQKRPGRGTYLESIIEEVGSTILSIVTIAAAKMRPESELAKQAEGHAVDLRKNLTAEKIDFDARKKIIADLIPKMPASDLHKIISLLMNSKPLPIYLQIKLAFGQLRKFQKKSK